MQAVDIVYVCTLCTSFSLILKESEVHHSIGSLIDGCRWEQVIFAIYGYAVKRMLFSKKRVEGGGRAWENQELEQLIAE